MAATNNQLVLATRWGDTVLTPIDVGISHLFDEIEDILQERFGRPIWNWCWMVVSPSREEHKEGVLFEVEGLKNVHSDITTYVLPNGMAFRVIRFSSKSQL